MLYTKLIIYNNFFVAYFFITLFLVMKRKGGNLGRLFHLEKSTSVHNKAGKSSYFFLVDFFSLIRYFLLQPTFSDKILCHRGEEHTQYIRTLASY